MCDETAGGAHESGVTLEEELVCGGQTGTWERKRASPTGGGMFPGWEMLLSHCRQGRKAEWACVFLVCCCVTTNYTTM